MLFNLKNSPTVTNVLPALINAKRNRVQVSRTLNQYPECCILLRVAQVNTQLNINVTIYTHSRTAITLSNEQLCALTLLPEEMRYDYLKSIHETLQGNIKNGYQHFT